MRNVRKISKKYYLRQIVACWLVYCLFFGMPMVARAVVDPLPGALPSYGTPGVDYQVGAGSIGSIGLVGSDMTINSVTNGTVIYINNHDIGQLASVTYDQGATDWALVKINDTLGSTFYGDDAATGIAGSLTATGNFIMSNNRGIVSAPGSYIQGRNLVLSAMRITDTDFGQFVDGTIEDLKFDTQAGDIGSVTINGDVYGAESVYIAAKNITNAGTILSPGGCVVMAAGDSALIGRPGSEVVVQVAMADPANRVIDNDGTIDATGGKVILAAGDIYSAAIEGVESLRAEAKRDITLEGAVSATGDITLAAGHNVDLPANKTLTTNGNLTIEATSGEIMAETSVIDMAADGKTLSLKQNAGMDLEQDFFVDNRINTNLVANSTGGSVTSDAAGEWGSITAHAADNITLSDISEVITTKALTADNGDIIIDSDQGDVVALDNIIAGGNIDIYSSDDTTYLGGDLVQATGNVTLHNNTELDGGGDQRIEATSGILTAKNDIAKTTSGAMTLAAGDTIYLGGDVTTKTPDVMFSMNNLRFEGPVIANGTGDHLDQTFTAAPLDAEAGSSIYANSTITKKDGGDLEIDGDGGSLTLQGGWQVNIDGAVVVEDGSLTIEADQDIYLGGNVTSWGSMVIAADADGDAAYWDSLSLDPFWDDYIGGDVTAQGNLTSEMGDITISGFDKTIYLNGDYVEAAGNVNLKNTTVAADGILINAINGDLIVGDGTADGTTLTGEGALTVEAGRHITLGGAVVASDNVAGDLILKADADTDAVGDMTAYGTITNTANGGGNIDIYSSDTTTYLHDDVTAGVDITLHNNAWAADGVKLDGGQDVTVGNGTADGTTLTGEGALTVEADRHITLGGAVVASDDVAGDLILKADAGSLGGDMTAYSTITNTANGGGSIDIYSSDTTTYLHDDVTAGVDLKLHNDAWAADGVTLDAGDDVEAFGTVTGEGDLTIHAGTIESGSASDYANIRLHQMVTVEGSLVMTAGDDIEAAGTLMATGTNGAGNMILNAGDDIDLDGTAVSAQSSGLMELIADLDPSNGTGNVDVAGSLEGNMKLSGTNVYVNGTVTSHGTLDVDADDDIMLKANVSSVGEMTMDAGSDIELNRNSGNTSSEESTVSLNAGDSITIGKAFGGNGNVTADGHMDIYAGTDSEDNVKVFGKLTTTNSGNIDVTAGGDIILGGSIIDSEYESAQADGDLTLDAEDDLKVLGDLISNNGSIELSSDNTTTYLGGNVTAAIDVTLNNNTKFYGFGDQKVDAQTGKITAKGWLRKASCWGSLYLEAAGDVSLADWVGVDNGGVSIISENGKIFTPDELGGETDTLNVAIDGYSDQLEGDGVSLPLDPDKRAAIVIISKEDLKLGPDSVLIANGYYIPLHAIDLDGITSFDELNNYWDELYNEFGDVIDYLQYSFEDYLEGLDVDPEDFTAYKELLGDYLAGLDDRPAIGFLAEPLTAIGGIIRNEGDPIDVAVYLQSETGDVDVESQLISVNYNGTMVVDAYDTVRFGDLTSEPATQTVESIEVPDGRFWEIDRLEVVSRLTEWLFEADAFGTLPHPYNPEIVEAFIGGEYVLRGAGLGNPDILDGRAWVLEDPLDPAPLYEEAGEAAEKEEFGEGGCPALMDWLAIEIGIPADDIQVTLAGALALNTDVQPCEMCARLKDAATTMEDAEGTRIASMARVVNEFVTTPAPPSPEQMTQIAAALSEHVGDGTYYALAGEWIDALVAYVGIMNTEMGYSASDSAAFANKYLAPVTETGNAALIAYVQARLAALGG